MKPIMPAPALALILAAGLTGCMDPIYDHKECRAIEHARCDLRKECDPKFDDATCRAYYDELCRTRRLQGPGSDTLTAEQLQACLDAIAAFPCGELNPGINETTLLPECGFIRDVDDPGSDTDADQGDAGPDTEEDLG